MEINEEALKHELEIAAIEARKAAFARSPFWFTFWDLARKILEIILWVLFWGIVAQCSCQCII